MKTLCKFVCTQKKVEIGSVGYSFIPVVSGSEENKEFFKYTPSGALQFNCLNEKVDFEVGKEYLITIEKA